MPPSFLDTNLLLRHLRQDHAVFSPKATAFLRRVELGEIKVRTSDTVIFEAVFTLQRTYRVAKAAIRDMLLPIIGLPGVILPGKRRFRKVFDFYVRLNIGFADAYHAILMQRLRLTDIATFDGDFDRIPGIRRVAR